MLLGFWTIPSYQVVLFCVKEIVTLIDTEIWLDIVGYEGIYQVSNHGRVRSLQRLVRNGPNTFRTVHGKLLKLDVLSDGYIGIGLHKDDHCKYYKVHRLVANAFIPNPENKPMVNHIDGNKQNNCVDNLEWVTSSENVQHALQIGLIPIICGRIPSDMTRKRISDNSKQSRPVLYVETGQIFKSRREASRVTGISENRIYNCISSGRTICNTTFISLN